MFFFVFNQSKEEKKVSEWTWEEPGKHHKIFHMDMSTKKTKKTNQNKQTNNNKKHSIECTKRYVSESTSYDDYSNFDPVDSPEPIAKTAMLFYACFLYPQIHNIRME